jgi:protein-tyrosine phosphatase
MSIFCWRRAAVALTILASPGPAMALDGAQVIRDDGKLIITWNAKRPVDIFVADRPDAAIRDAKPIGIADADGRADFDDPGLTRRYFLLREAGQRPVRVAERLLPLATGSNFRDIGGYPAAGGKYVRWGLIYRSGATPILNDTDLARIQALGLRTMIDLRSSEERTLAPTRIGGVRYESVGYSMMTMMGDRKAMTNGGNLYRNFPTFFAPQLRLIFGDLLGNKGPVVYNCSAGQDRTGFATAMILAALGVPRATIVEDYHLSTQYRKPENEMPKITPAMAEANPVAKLFAAYQSNPAAAKPQSLTEPDGRAFLDSAFDEIEKRWGSVDAYLEKEIGIGAVERTRLRRAYTE